MAGWNVSVNFAVLSNGSAITAWPRRRWPKRGSWASRRLPTIATRGQAILVDAFDHHWYPPDVDSIDALLRSTAKLGQSGGE